VLKEFLVVASYSHMDMKHYSGHANILVYNKGLPPKTLYRGKENFSF